MTSSADIVVGQTFPSLNEAKDTITSWAIDRGESFKSGKSDKSRGVWMVVCRDPTICGFRIRVNVLRNQQAQITICTPHTCPPSTHYNWRTAHSVKHVVMNPRNKVLVADDSKAKAKAIRSNQRLDCGVDVSYKQAWRAREQLKDAIFGDETESFKRIPALLQAMERDSKGRRMAYTKVEVDKDNRFRRCYVFPKATINSFEHCRKFVAMDGTHCTATHRLTLLALTTLDGNGNILPLCWALVPSEDAENWIWFLQKAANFFPLDEPDAVIISDRGKGLSKAIPDLFPHVTHSYCSQHLAENVVKDFGEKMRRPFWRCAKARTRGDFVEAMKRVHELDNNCGDYIAGIPVEHWVPYAFERPRYGQLTSNIQESQNSSWLAARDMPALHLLKKIWEDTMNIMFTRQTRKFKSGNRVTDLAWNHIQQAKENSRRYTTSSSTGTEAMVTVYHTEGTQHIVCLKSEERQCTCLELQDLRLPCRHCIAICKEHNLEPENYVDEIYSVNAYRQTYNPQDAMHCVRMEEIKADPNCKAPLISKKP